jgi:hypothetical protein
MSWYTEGEDGLDEDEKAEKAENQSKGAKRFFLRENTEREIIFLSDAAVRIWEHNPLVNGEWQPGNWYTCRQGIFRNDPSCAMCQGNIDRYKIGFYSIMDTTEFTFKGKTYKNLRRLLALRIEGMKRAKIKKDRQGGLVGRRFLFSRTSKKAPNIGNDWEFMQEEETFRACPECRAQLEEMAGDEGVVTYRCPEDRCSYTGPGLMLLADKEYWWQDRERTSHPPMPYDIKKILAPLSNDDMRRALREGGRRPDSSQSSDSGSGDSQDQYEGDGPGVDEDIPF